MSDDQNPEDAFSKGDFESMLGGGDPAEVPKEAVSLWHNFVRAYTQNRSGILVKGIIIAEVIDPNGDRNLIWSYPDDMMAWELLGMTEQVRADVIGENQAQILAAHQEVGEDEDE